MLGRRVVTVAALVLVGPGGLAGAPQQQPREVPREVGAACDAAYAISAQTPGTVVERRTGTFIDETLPAPVFGCGLGITGSFSQAETTGDAAVRIRQDFESRGWQEMAAYSADGTDGTSFAFRQAGVACLVRGTWDGGAADDPSLPALDGYEVAVFCTSPAFSEDRS